MDTGFFMDLLRMSGLDAIVDTLRQLKYAEKYYIYNQNEYLNKQNLWAKITTILNYISGGLFFVAVVITIIFVSLNLLKAGGNKMSELKTESAEIKEFGAEIPKMVKTVKPITSKSQERPKIEQGQPQKMIEKGAEIPTMQPVALNHNNIPSNNDSGTSNDSTGNSDNSGSGSDTTDNS